MNPHPGPLPYRAQHGTGFRKSTLRRSWASCAAWQPIARATPLYTVLQDKLNALPGVSDADKRALLDNAEKGIKASVQPTLQAATAYKVSMIKILELRQKARDRLGSRFDLKNFNVVLSNSSLPLAILERVVDDYIARKLA